MTDRTRDTRISTILHLLARREEVQVRTLADVLRVSGATVRRDLAVMEDKGLILRSYGKITATHRGAELPVSLRCVQRTEAKRRIGALASTLIGPGPRTVALGGGSTIGFVARVLAGRPDLTVVTNGLDTATVLMARQSAHVVVTGGAARPLSHDLVGRTATKTLRSYRFDVAVVGADGITAHAGPTRYSRQGAQTDRVMLEQAECRILVVDSSKFGQVHQGRIAPMADFDTVVTDSQAPEETVAALRRIGVRTTVVALPCPDGRRST